MTRFISEAAWLGCLQRLGLSDPESETFRGLTAAYSQDNRHYHNLIHIDDCLEQLSTCGLPATRADAMMLALWFHDAVYCWRSSNNEIESANWADKFLADNDAGCALRQTVEGLILATRHFVPEPRTGDQLTIIDIDLSILGRDPERYQQYETAIRREYSQVPDMIFRRERKKVLQNFLERDRIFMTEQFHALYEERARINLAQAIAAL